MNTQTHRTADKSEIYAMVSFGHKEREGEKNTNVFVFAYSGMVDAANVIDPDIRIEWHGPNAWDPIPEIKTIQELTARQVDGIMVTAADKTALDESINAAIQAGIPVINFDADSPASERLTLVATDNYKAGYLAGKTMAEWLGGQGDVAVSTIEHADHLIERLQGFKDALSQYAPQTNIYVAYDSGNIDVDESGRQDFTEYRQSYIRMIQAHPEIRGLFTTYSIPGVGAAEATEELGQQGKVQVLAFDFDEIIIKLVETEKIRATVGQDPYMMGYVSMVLLHAARHASEMPAKADGAWRAPVLADFLDAHPRIHKNTTAKLRDIVSRLEGIEAGESGLIDTGARILGQEELLDILAGDFEDMRDSISEKIEFLGREVEVRKQAERDLRRLNEELEQRVQERTSTLARQQYILNTFMENVPDYIYFKDLNSHITRANRAHAAHLGLDNPEQEVGKTDFDFFSEEQARVKFEQEQEIIRTGQPIQNLEEPSGIGQWTLTTKMPLRDEAGNIVGTFGISNDITERKQAEAERERLLAETERRALQLQTAAEVSRAASSILNVDELLPQMVELIRGRFNLYYVGIFLVNKADKYAVLRAGTGEAGRTMIEAGHKLEVGGASMIGWCIANQKARIALDVGAEAVRFGNPLLPLTRSELALPLVSRREVIGALTVQSAQAAAFSDEDITVLQTMADQVANAIANAQLYDQSQKEITERKRTEEALTREQYLMHALMDNLPAHIYFKDTESRFLRVGKSMADWISLSDPAQAVGKSDFDFFSEEHARPAYEDEQEIIRTGQPLVGVEEKETWADRPDTWVSTTKMPLRDEAGNIVGTFGISSDITERKRAEAERERLMDTLARRAVQLQTSAEVSHAAASILNLDELLPRTVELIWDRFGLYYTGIFLTDETGQWAALRAGTGEAGHKMLEANHRLQIGGASMIGWCVANAQARIALDVGEEAVRFGNPLLPLTRSEMALPLVSRSRVIGAMTIQSDQPAAFTQEDITVLQSLADQTANAIENARLFEDAKNRLAQLTALQETTRAVVSTLELDKLLHLITQQATTLLEGNGGITNLVDWEKKEDESVAACGSQVLTLGQRNSLEGGLSGWVAVHNQPVISNQLQNDDRVNLRFRSGILPGQNAAIAPFTVKDQVMGTLVVMDKQGGFDQADLDLLFAFANQAAIAIENARLFEETRAARHQAETRLREMQILQQVIQAASGTLDLERVLDALFDVLAREMGFTFIALNLIDESANELQTVRAIGLAQGNKGLVRPLDQVQNDILMDVARKGQIEVVDGWDDRLDRMIFEREGHAALVRAFVPLLLQEKPLGVLEVGYLRQERAVITPEEVRLLGSLADQLAVTIQNARLFEESQRRAAREQLVNRMTAHFARSLDIDTILQTVVRELGESLSVREVSVLVGSPAAPSPVRTSEDRL